MNREIKLTEQDGFRFAFKAADTTDSSIISYGWASVIKNRNPDIYSRPQIKITYKDTRIKVALYFVFLKLGRKYVKHSYSSNLQEAIELAKKHWISRWS